MSGKSPRHSPARSPPPPPNRTLEDMEEIRVPSKVGSHTAREHSRHNSADAAAYKRRTQVHRSQSSPIIDQVKSLKSQTHSPSTTPTISPTRSTSPFASPSSSPFTSPSSPPDPPIALPSLSVSEPPPKLSFTDFSNQWRALTTQVGQGLSSCVHLAEFFQSVSEPNDSNCMLGLDMQPALQSVEAIIAEDRLERARLRRTNALIVEQVAKPLLQFCSEARECFNSMVKEEQQLSKIADATTIAVQSQKIDCLVVWDERKSTVEQFPSLKPSGADGGRRASSTKKRHLESAFRMFKQYEVCLKRATVDQHRFVRDMNRLLVALEDLERSRIRTLNTYSQIYSQLKQRPIVSTSPDEQIQEFLTTKFDPAERCPLRFTALPYDLPCSAEDLREGNMLSSPEIIGALSAEIASAVNAPEAFFSTPLAPLSLTSQAIPLNLPLLLGHPDGSRSSSMEKLSLPRFEEKDIGLRRSRISRLLLNIEEPDLPKPKPEESDQESSGYLELMMPASSWKTLYCSARAGKLLLCAKKDVVGQSAKFPLRAARFIRYGRGEIPMRQQCFGVFFPHSGQRLVFACKTEQAVQDWLQTLSRVAVTDKGILGRSLTSPLDGAVSEEPSLLERLDAIEKALSPLRGYATAELSEWIDSESDEESEADGSSTFTSHVDGKLSRLTPAVKGMFLKAELDGYLDRLLTGLVRHEPHGVTGLHWDLMAATPRKCLGVLKVFLSPPNVLVALLRGVLPRHKSLDRLAKAVLNIAMFTGTVMEVLDALIEEEVAKTPFDTQLFRTDSLSSKMMGFYAISEGKSYLGKMLAKPVQAVVLDASANDAPAVEFELDPAKISHVKSMHEHFKNKESVGDSKSLGLPAASPIASSSGTKAISWWAKKLHDTKSPEEPNQSTSRRTSFNTIPPATPSSGAPSANPPSPAPSMFRRVSMPKGEENSLFTPLPDDNQRKVSGATSVTTATDPPSTRNGSLEQIFFPRSGRSESHAERKASDAASSPPTRSDKPKPPSVTSADNPTDFIKERKVAQNLAHLEQCCMYFLMEITKSLDYCPRTLRVVAHSVYRAVGVKFPSARLTAVGGFFFLRFLCPQLLQVAWSPEANSIAAPAKRNLLMLTKVLQFLANCATEEPMSREQSQAALAAKEASMMPLAEFVHAQGPRISQFLHHLAEPPDPQFLKTLIDPTPQLLEEQGREVEADFEWFLSNVLTVPDEEGKASAG